MLHLEQVIHQDPTSATDEPSDAKPLVGYIKVPVKDIVGYLNAADDDATAGQSVIWIRRNAMLVWHEAERAPSLEAPESAAKLEWPR
jgi:hypothetical protein